MEYSVYLRPLVLADAEISYRWRNNPALWRHTGSKPDRHVTLEMEREWLATVLRRDHEKRFAICLKDGGRYIGNIFLTDIGHGEAQIHIVVGDTSFLGEGRTDQAVLLLIEHAFSELALERLYAVIKKRNRLSVALALRTGFTPVSEEGDAIRFVVSKAI